MESLALFTIPSTSHDEDSGQSDDDDSEGDTRDEIEDANAVSPDANIRTTSNIMWHGTITSHGIGLFRATARYIGGVDVGHIGLWSQLLPRHLTVNGRAQQESVNEYLCGLQYSSLMTVVRLQPIEAEEDEEKIHILLDELMSTHRYGVVGSTTATNIRDIYLVPVPAGNDRYPIFMDPVASYLPKRRKVRMLLSVFVYRNEPEKLEPPQPKVATTSTGQESAIISKFESAIPPKTSSELLVDVSGTPPLNVDDHPERARKQSRKHMLSIALRKSNEAVDLDNANNLEGALLAYGEACDLLQDIQQMKPFHGVDEQKLKAIVR
jgi:hypothetical protein